MRYQVLGLALCAAAFAAPVHDLDNSALQRASRDIDISALNNEYANVAKREAEAEAEASATDAFEGEVESQLDTRQLGSLGDLLNSVLGVVASLTGNVNGGVSDKDPLAALTAGPLLTQIQALLNEILGQVNNGTASKTSVTPLIDQVKPLVREIQNTLTPILKSLDPTVARDVKEQLKELDQQIGQVEKGTKSLPKRDVAAKTPNLGPLLEGLLSALGDVSATTSTGVSVSDPTTASSVEGLLTQVTNLVNTIVSDVNSGNGNKATLTPLTTQINPLVRQIETALDGVLKEVDPSVAKTLKTQLKSLDKEVSSVEKGVNSLPSLTV